jgi:hypothetical protein
VNSRTRITLESKGEIQPQADRENAFARANAGEAETERSEKSTGDPLVSDVPLSDMERTRIETPRRGAPGGFGNVLILWCILVAGTGFEPVTFRL